MGCRVGFSLEGFTARRSVLCGVYKYGEKGRGRLTTKQFPIMVHIRIDLCTMVVIRSFCVSVCRALGFWEVVWGASGEGRHG